ncbi:MAG: hypothetical protein JZU65_01130, partial [Chlorobium sp.]|nr:hypothetical protein [Chlorobium sp.]
MQPVVLSCTHHGRLHRKYPSAVAANLQRRSANRSFPLLGPTFFKKAAKGFIGEQGTNGWESTVCPHTPYGLIGSAIIPRLTVPQTGELPMLSFRTQREISETLKRFRIALPLEITEIA